MWEKKVNVKSAKEDIRWFMTTFPSNAMKLRETYINMYMRLCTYVPDGIYFPDGNHFNLEKKLKYCISTAA